MGVKMHKGKDSIGFNNLSHQPLKITFPTNQLQKENGQCYGDSTSKMIFTKNLIQYKPVGNF
jgi:hypothetical protein